MKLLKILDIIVNEDFFRLILHLQTNQQKQQVSNIVACQVDGLIDATTNESAHRGLRSIGLYTDPHLVVAMKHL